MNYLSVCSGIEAASVAWRELDWSCAGVSEIERFPRAVLSERFPEFTNYGDINQYREWPIEPGSVQLIVGGTPCQSFSVAGLRRGLADSRGQILFAYLGLVERLRPEWVVWENVPGVLSSNEGRDFGSFLGALEEFGYGWAYRTLDAQFFRVAQQRRRVFVVGHLGDWRVAGSVLFEPESLRGDSPPGQGERKEVTGTLSARASGGGGLGTDFECAGGAVSHALNAKGGSGRTDWGPETFVVDKVATSLRAQPQSAHDESKESYVISATGKQVSHALKAEGADASEDGTGRGVPVIMLNRPRRLTPLECERLQGFPDEFTRIPYRGKPAAECPDGPRYKAIGNSMAVPVMRWLGERIWARDRHGMN